MRIHFVCLGNTFRSRLAEAYAKSRFTEHTYSSSGLEASKNVNGAMTWYGQMIAEKEHLLPFLFPTWRQLDWDGLVDYDLVICLDAGVGKVMKEHLSSFTGLHIVDVPDVVELKDRKKMLEQAMQSFQKIVRVVEGIDCDFLPDNAKLSSARK